MANLKKSWTFFFDHVPCKLPGCVSCSALSFVPLLHLLPLSILQLKTVKIGYLKVVLKSWKSHSLEMSSVRMSGIWLYIYVYSALCWKEKIMDSIDKENCCLFSAEEHEEQLSGCLSVCSLRPRGDACRVQLRLQPDAAVVHALWWPHGAATVTWN